MTSRTIAIGDIHGCATALKSLILAIDPQPDETIVTLGDYVNRGANSKGVIELLIELSGRCHLLPLLGNHDEMMIRARDCHSDFRQWMKNGGAETLKSYSANERIDAIPTQHFAFLESGRNVHETSTHFCVHANYRWNLDLDEQDVHTLRWLSLRNHVPGPHQSGKIAIVGHTPQTNGAILDLGYLQCLDTACYHGGWLTALELESGLAWQANERGAVRERHCDTRNR